MKTATVRELRNRYTQLLKWLDAGEEIVITRRGVTAWCRKRRERNERLIGKKAPRFDWIDLSFDL